MRPFFQSAARLVKNVVGSSAVRKAAIAVATGAAGYQIGSMQAESRQIEICEKEHRHTQRYAFTLKPFTTMDQSDIKTKALEDNLHNFTPQENKDIRKFMDNFETSFDFKNSLDKLLCEKFMNCFYRLDSSINVDFYNKTVVDERNSYTDDSYFIALSILANPKIKEALNKLKTIYDSEETRGKWEKEQIRLGNFYYASGFTLEEGSGAPKDEYRYEKFYDTPEIKPNAEQKRAMEEQFAIIKNVLDKLLLQIKVGGIYVKIDDQPEEPSNQQGNSLRAP